MLLAFETLYKGSITLYKRGEEKEGKREKHNYIFVLGRIKEKYGSKILKRGIQI